MTGWITVNDDVGGYPQPDEQVAPGDGERVADRPAGPGAQSWLIQRYGDRGHDAALAVSFSSARPESRLGRSPARVLARATAAAAALALLAGLLGDVSGQRQEHVVEARAAAARGHGSRRRRRPGRAQPRRAPPSPGRRRRTLTRPVSASIAARASRSVATAVDGASPIRARSGTVNSSTSPPTRLLSSSAVPAAMTTAAGR